MYEQTHYLTHESCRNGGPPLREPTGRVTGILSISARNRRVDAGFPSPANARSKRRRRCG